MLRQQKRKIKNIKRKQLENQWKRFVLSQKAYVKKKIYKNAELKLYRESVLSEFIFKESFETIELGFILKQLKKGDVFFDIGANIGLYTVLASKIVGKTGRVFSFEPVKDIFEKLSDNVRHNKLSNCHLYNLALSDKNGKSVITTSGDGYDAWSSLAKPSAGVFFDEEEVSTITLSSFFRNSNIKKVDFIKIDVEGWEINVLGGAAEILTKYSPQIMIEFTEQNLLNAGHTSKQLFNLITSLGYKLHRINKDFSIIPEELKPEYPYINLIAIKTD